MILILLIIFHLANCLESSDSFESWVDDLTTSQELDLSQDKPPVNDLIEEKVDIMSPLGPLQPLKDQPISSESQPQPSLNTSHFKATWNSRATKNYISKKAFEDSESQIIPTIIPKLNELTVSMWLKDTSSGTNTWIMSYYTSQSRGIYMYYEHSGNKYHIYAGNEYSCDSTASLSRGVWRHLLFTWKNDGGNFEVYLDGVKLTCTASIMQNGHVIPEGFGKHMILGGYQDSAGVLRSTHQFVGEMAYVNVYDTYTSKQGVAKMKKKRCGDGNVFSWDYDSLTFHGNVSMVTYSPGRI